MKKETLEALKGSIEKWEEIVAGTGTDQGISNCPLCKLFVHQDDACFGCPVRERTNKPSCEDTPYVIWCKVHPSFEAKTPYQKAIAQAEVEFLKSLLPKELEVDIEDIYYNPFKYIHTEDYNMISIPKEVVKAFDIPGKLYPGVTIGLLADLFTHMREVYRGQR